MRSILPVAAMFVLSMMAAAALADEPLRQISVTGSGEVEVVPDLATVTLGVENRRATAGEALAENAAAMTAVFTALEAAGIARTDIQTSQIGLEPVWEDRRDGTQEPPKVIAYEARNMVNIRVREIGRLGVVIDGIGAAGANRIYGIGFAVAEPGSHLDEARRKAVADGRARAELYADAVGVTLGQVVSIAESGGGMPRPMMARADMAMEKMPVAEGSVSISAGVEMVYAIK